MLGGCLGGAGESSWNVDGELLSNNEVRFIINTQQRLVLFSSQQ
jgi:hypothetical protein